MLCRIRSGAAAKAAFFAFVDEIPTGDAKLGALRKFTLAQSVIPLDLIRIIAFDTPVNGVVCPVNHTVFRKWAGTARHDQGKAGRDPAKVEKGM
jgi:hypothetical protein